MNIKAALYYLGKINFLIIFFSLVNILYCIYFDFKINLHIYFLTLFFSIIFYLVTFKLKFNDKNYRAYDLIIFAVLGWLILPLLTTLPFWFGNYANFLDSYFESISGFSSFGASIFSEKLNLLDPPILLWRSSTQIIGAIYFIMTIILVLGNREINIYPLKFITIKKDTLFFSKNFRNIFHNTVYAYTIIFLISLFLLNFTDLRMLDKFNLLLTIISTGGFESTKLILSNTDKLILSFLFLLSSLNIFFILGLLKINNSYSYDEDKYFLICFLLLFFLLLFFSQNNNIYDILIQLSSAISNSGINFATYNESSITFILLSASFIGGCLVSSSSGFKITRILIVFNKIYYELLKLLTPSAVINSTIFNSNEKIQSKDFYSSCLLLMFYIIIFILFSFLLTLEKLSFEDSFLTSVLITFNTVPSTLFLSKEIIFSNFSNISLLFTIVILIFSKVTPLSIIAIIKYKFMR